MSTPFLLTSIPAHWNDDLLLVCPSYKQALSSPKKFAARALSLLINITVFPLFLTIDTIIYSGKALGQKCWNRLTSAQTTETHNKTHHVAIKCLRGILAWPAGLIWPDVVSNHFLCPKAQDKRIHPKGNLYTAEAECHTPKTVTDVVHLVKTAIRENKKISIAGTGYCQGKQTLPPSPDDLHVNMQNINHVHIDKKTKIARVGGGATWGQIQNKADTMGLAVQVMQASNVFSIGGSLSANCHGWDHTAGSVANTVVAITIIDASGTKRRLTPDDDQFRYIMGGYGLFGIILEAEIQLTDNQELFDEGEAVAIDAYPQYFDEKVLANPQIKMHLYRLSLERGKLLQKGWAENYVVKAESATTARLTDEAPRGTDTDRILMQVARNSFLFRNFYWWTTEKDLKTIKKATRNEIMRPPIHAAFATNSRARAEWLQEYFVPKDKLPQFLSFLSEVLNKNDVTLLNASVRFVKQDTNAALGYATKGDRFAIVLFFSQSLNNEEVLQTQKWVQQVIDKLIEIGGTFYLPYMHFAIKEQFQQCYPQWEEVVEAKQTYDPQHRFDNGLFRDYFIGEQL